MSKLIIAFGVIVMIIASIFMIRITLDVEIRPEEMNTYMLRIIVVLVLLVTGLLMVILGEDTHVSKLKWDEDSPYLSNLK